MNLFDNVSVTPVSSSLLAPMKSMQRCLYEEGDATPMHSTNYSHSILALDGEAVFQEQGKEEFLCRRGTFFAIPSGVFYRWRIVKQATLFQCLHGPFSFLEHRGLANLFGVSNKHIVNFDLEKGVFETCLQSLEADAREEEPIRGLNLSADWLKVMVLATAMFNAGDRSKHPAIMKAIDYLVENVERNVPLEELARKSGLGVSRISQLFREEVGMSPLRYLSMLKAERATNLLMAEELSVCEIAEQLGFTSTSSFRRFYKSQTRIPPGQVVNRKSRR